MKSVVRLRRSVSAVQSKTRKIFSRRLLDKNPAGIITHRTGARAHSASIRSCRRTGRHGHRRQDSLQMRRKRRRIRRLSQNTSSGSITTNSARKVLLLLGMQDTETVSVGAMERRTQSVRAVIIRGMQGRGTGTSRPCVNMCSRHLGVLVEQNVRSAPMILKNATI